MELLSNLPFNVTKFVYLRFWAKDTDHPSYVINSKSIKQLCTLLKCFAVVANFYLFLDHFGLKTDKSLLPQQIISNSVQQHKDVGVTFSIDLNWAAHHKVITVKAYQTLGLIRRIFKTGCSTEAKKKLVCSQLIYCSQLWRPQLIKDITALERIQRRATKYILNDYNSSYKSRLQQLHMLPLMYIYELNDIKFLVKSLKSPTDNFDIKNYITFASNSTRSGVIIIIIIIT